MQRAKNGCNKEGASEKKKPKIKDFFFQEIGKKGYKRRAVKGRKKTPFFKGAHEKKRCTFF